MDRRRIGRAIAMGPLCAGLVMAVAGCQEAEAVLPVAESPLLAAAVAAGDLPPLAERMPAEPLVVETSAPAEGAYGGTLRMLDRELRLWSTTLMRQSSLFRYDQAVQEVLPDIAKGYAFAEEGKLLTVDLRPGHRWSDGSPFTSADILFWWEAYGAHPDFGGEAVWGFPVSQVQVEAVSETQLRFRFPEPAYRVIDRWGRAQFSADGPSGMMLPKHFLEGFHADYNPVAQSLAEAAGFERWQQHIDAYVSPFGQLAALRPTLSMWVPERNDLALDIGQEDAPVGLPVGHVPLPLADPESIGWPEMADPARELVLVRNPYFHQIDLQGRQLPYIDRLASRVYRDHRIFVDQLQAGGSDFEGYFLSPADRPGLSEGLAGKPFRLLEPTDLRGSEFTLHPNQNARDADLAALYQAQDFRMALSLAIDRQAIADQVFGGLATPMPALPLPSNGFFDSGWTASLVAHDPAEAASLLDGLGLVAGSDGMRSLPDGSPLSLSIEHAESMQLAEPICERLSEDFAAVGLDLACEPLSLQTFRERQTSNNLKMPAWRTGRATRLLRTDPRWFGFQDPTYQFWAGRWTTWLNTGGSGGVEPPAEILALAELYERWEATEYGSRDYRNLGREYFQYFADQVPMIGTVGMAAQPLLVADRLGGVPEAEIHWDSDANFYAPYQPATWYLIDEAVP